MKIRNAKKLGRIRARLQDHALGFACQEQRPVGLNRSRQVNLLTVTVG